MTEATDLTAAATLDGTEILVVGQPLAPYKVTSLRLIKEILALSGQTMAFGGAVTVAGNTTLGDASGDTVTVNAGAIEAANATLELGSTTAATYRLFVYHSHATDAAMFVRQDGAGPIAQFSKSATISVEIDTDGNLNVGGSGGTGRIVTHGSSYLTAAFQIINTTHGANFLMTSAAGGGWQLVDRNNGDATRLLVDTSGNLLVGYASSNGAYKLQVNSQIFATSATIATSDGRYKENVATLSGALELVNALRPVSFTWKQHPVHDFDRATPTIGFIAQEVQEALADQPWLGAIVKANECVITPAEVDGDGNELAPAVTEEFLGIAEGNLVALLAAALKEASAKIDALTDRVAALENA